MKRIKRIKRTPAVRDTTKAYTPEDLYSSLDALQGAEIESVIVMPAEVPRTVDNYVLLRIRLPLGERVRLILIAAEIKRPCPRDTDMLDTDGFFDIDEYKARRLDKAFELLEFFDDDEQETPSTSSHK